MRFLFVDRILRLLPGQEVQGLKHITRDDHYLCYDAQGKLYFPASLIGEALGQLAAWNVMVSNNFTQRPVAGLVSKACLHRPAYLGETLLLESFIDELDEVAVRYHSVARVGDEVVFTIESALGPLLPMEDFIDRAVVCRQYAEINRPGTWPDCNPSSLAHEVIALAHSMQTSPMVFDHIMPSQPPVALCAEKRITRAASYFPDHFPHKPVLPMTVLLECKLNLVQDFLLQAQFTEHYVIREMRRIKMNEFVHPGDVVVCYLTQKQHSAGELILNLRSEVEGKRVCNLDVVLTAKGI